VVKPEPGAFQDFDSSYDGTQVFVAHSSCSYGCSGPGDITIQPALGGKEKTIYSNQAYSVVAVRTVTQKTLLFEVRNAGFPAQNSGDLSHNGQWKVNTDGTGLTQLSNVGAGVASIGFINLCPYTQYPWSNVSRDGNLYAEQVNHTQGQPTVSLNYGLLSGGSTTIFDFSNDANTSQLSIVGWTTI
jgi:hypothetical protein